jgi:iduronate 2-sulfatase
LKIGRTLTLLIAALTSCSETPDRASVPLNVLFIAVDDLRPELGTYDAPVLTPHIDQLAAEGIRFDHAYTEVAACGASRASLMTGTYSRTTRVAAMKPPLSLANPALLTMPQLFKSAGYETIEIGKFQHFTEDAPHAWSRPHWDPDQRRPHYEAPRNRRFSGVRSQPRGPFAEAVDVPDDSYGDGKLALRAVDQLREISDRPFFMALGFRRPHLPMNCPKKYWDLYDRDEIRLPTGDVSGVAKQEFHGNYEVAMYSGFDARNHDASRTLVHAYRACVSYIDAQIGRVLDELDRLQLAERTIVVLWGDHGWHLGEHQLWGKFTLLEPSLRIPLILRVPGRTDGRSASGFVETVDILPTLCELTGIDIPAQVEGVSFTRLLDDPTREWKQAVFGSRKVFTRDFPHAAMTVRTPRFRLVRWFDKSNRRQALELYDHESDPREYVNLASEVEHQARVVALNAMIDQWSIGRTVGHPR